ncbi:hypothetical protein BC832DRAFT_241353 [Gaertneriomyces semiglobifer]|nr:hypothetical protein BC832DRAFT_241353 [Gaertneriomyces semiglobifer]
MDIDEISDNKERRANELLALEAIYSHDFQYETSEQGDIYGTLHVRLDLGDEVLISVPSLSPTIETIHSDIERSAVSVRFLPSVVIRFRLCQEYPSRRPPQFVIECPWLGLKRRGELSRALMGVWNEEKDVCLFRFAEVLEEECIGRVKTNVANRLELDGDISNKAGILNVLVESDRQMAQQEFEQSMFFCGICMEQKSGVACHQLRSCRHVFCRPCLVNYFTLLITEGNVLSVRCPHRDCKKAEVDEKRSNALANSERLTMLASDIRELLSADLVSRYETLLYTHQLSLTNSLFYCPRPDCQAPVARDPKQEKLCVCHSCGFAFCSFCNSTWHGNAQFCRMNNTDTVILQYLAAEKENNTKKLRELEVRYGKTRLPKMVKAWVEQEASREWLESNSQKCPRCLASISKSEGCNHMQCQFCHTHFCYRCGAKLDSSTPYYHYHDVKSPCHGLLFDFMPAEVNDVDDNWANDLIFEN